jgi:hypothetical protein
MPKLNQWFVCPVEPFGGCTTEARLDRTQGFLVRTDVAEIALSLAKKAEPKYEFTGETIPYLDYTPGLSTNGLLEDLQRWIGYMNHPDSLPLGSVIQMD